MEKFDALFQPIASKIDMVATENQQLSSLRDWLLPMLMNGQVKVKSAKTIKIGYEREEEIKVAAEPETQI